MRVVYIHILQGFQYGKDTVRFNLHQLILNISLVPDHNEQTQNQASKDVDE